jgi:glycosyltransferase involved in cell wall biosynthesis
VTATVSIVIPTRNRWSLLPRALDSALRQEAVTVEVIVVDDASDPVAVSIPQLDDPRVKLVRHQRRRGVAAARNSGMREASARWVAFLDDDDLWAPHRLHSILDSVIRTKADFGYCAAVTVDECLRPLMLQPAPVEMQLMRELLRRNAIPGGGSNVVASVSLLEQTGGFDESFSFLADWDMWIRLADEGRPALVPDVLIAYSHHADSWVLSGDTAVSQDLNRLIKKHDALSRRFEVTVDVLEHDRYVAYSLWLAGRRREAARRFLAVAREHRDPGCLVRAATALLERDLVARLRPAQRRPPGPEWLRRFRASEIAE